MSCRRDRFCYHPVRIDVWSDFLSPLFSFDIFMFRFHHFYQFYHILSFYIMCRWHSIKRSTNGMLYMMKVMENVYLPGFVLHTYDNKFDEWLLYYQRKLLVETFAHHLIDLLRWNVLAHQLIQNYGRTPASKFKQIESNCSSIADDNHFYGLEMRSAFHLFKLLVSNRIFTVIYIWCFDEQRKWGFLFLPKMMLVWITYYFHFVVYVYCIWLAFVRVAVWASVHFIFVALFRFVSV